MAFLNVVSLGPAAPFVVPAEGERPSKERRVKTTFVVTPFRPWKLGGANHGACQVWCTQCLHISLTEARAQYREPGSIQCHAHDYQIAGGDLS